MQKNIILNSLKETFVFSWKSKWLFALIFILQIIFFAAFSVVSMVYQTRILESAKSITDYIGNLNMTDVSAAQDILHQRNVLGDDPLSISRNFGEIQRNFRFYMAYSFILIVFFISILWSLTVQIRHNNSLNHFIKIFSGITIVSAFYLGLIFSFFIFLFSISFTEIANAGLLYTYAPFLIFSIVLLYFMFISLSIIHKVELKDIVQKTVMIGLKRAHYILAAYLINIFLFLISTLLLVYYFKTSIFITFFAIMLMILSFVFGRIFIFSVVDKLLE